MNPSVCTSFGSLGPGGSMTGHDTRREYAPGVSLDTQRRALADACHQLAREGLVIGTAGNVSVRCGDEVVVSPTGCVLAEVAPESMSVVSLDGSVQEGEPTSELGLHLGVYRAMDWTGAVVHTHSPMATAVGCVVDELPAIHYGMLALGGSVRVAPYATFGSPELADNSIKAMEGRFGAILQNHGATTYGDSLAKAYTRSVYLEWVCRMYYQAKLLGQPNILPDDEIARVAEKLTTYGQTVPDKP
jgi:L-fuculose-phosphate aldolase